MESYHLLCEPILDAFSKVGIDVQYTEEERDALYQPGCYLRELHPAHDMVTPDGRKIAGNAQYRQKDVVVQHGSLSYAVSPEKHLACFTGHDVTPEEYRERVTGVSELVDVSREEFVTAVEEALMEWCDAEVGSWTHEELAAAEELAEKKYRAESWVRHGEDPT